MKAGASGINAHIQLGQTTTARLLKVTRVADGQVFGFTDHDVDIVFSAVTYLSTTSFNPFNLSDKDTAEAPDTELTGAFDSVITRIDVLAELWDNATFQLIRVNWANLSDGGIIDLTGTFGEFEPQEFGFRVALHGLAYPLTFPGGETCQPTCRVDFGSSKCAPSGLLDDGTAINSLLQNDTVASTADGITSLVGTTIAATGKPFDGALLTWTGGGNANLSVEVLHVDFATKTITLRPWTQIALIAPGDTFSLFPACDKIFQTCAGVWNNARNNQAEPHVPGPDQSLAYPDYVAPHG